MISAWRRPSRPPRQQHSHKPLARLGTWTTWTQAFVSSETFSKHGNKMQSFPKSSKLGLFFFFFFSDQDVTNLAFWQTPRYVICPVSSMTVRAVAGGDGFSGYSEHPLVQVFCIWENEGNWSGFKIPFYYDLTNTTRKNKTREARWGRSWWVFTKTEEWIFNQCS